MITILNASILTNFGCYEYRELTLEQVKDIISKEGWKSAIGHISTAKLISKILNINCLVNRITYSQKLNEQAIVFKLKGRLESRKFFTLEELEKCEHSWGLLIRRF
jgi:hypothetical protein